VDLISETLVTWLDLISETLQTLCVEADGTSLDDTPRWKLVTWACIDQVGGLWCAGARRFRRSVSRPTVGQMVFQSFA
jgi:hypothetical protein